MSCLRRLTSCEMFSCALILFRSKTASCHTPCSFAADMPSQCNGPLCIAASQSGGNHKQGRKKYHNMCPACFHAVRGTNIQEHRSEGSRHRCRNWPSCIKLQQAGCNGYCSNHFKSAGHALPTRKRPAAPLTRRSPAHKTECTESSLEIVMSPKRRLRSKTTPPKKKTKGDHARRACKECAGRARKWDTSGNPLCLLCAQHKCDQCHSVRSSIQAPHGRKLCCPCAQQNHVLYHRRTFNKDEIKPTRVAQCLSTMCSDADCPHPARVHLTAWSSAWNGSLPGFICRQAGFHETQAMIQKWPSSNQCVGGPEALQSLDQFFDQAWNQPYCKKHAAWLINLAIVLGHVVEHGCLPLNGDSQGLHRWLRTQLQSLRSHLQGATILSPNQASHLQGLPKWQSTGRWQKASCKQKQAQVLRRQLAHERACMLHEDARTLFLERVLPAGMKARLERAGITEPTHVIRTIGILLQGVHKLHQDAQVMSSPQYGSMIIPTAVLENIRADRSGFESSASSDWSLADEDTCAESQNANPTHTDNLNKITMCKSIDASIDSANAESHAIGSTHDEHVCRSIETTCACTPTQLALNSESAHVSKLSKTNVACSPPRLTSKNKSSHASGPSKATCTCSPAQPESKNESSHVYRASKTTCACSPPCLTSKNKSSHVSGAGPSACACLPQSAAPKHESSHVPETTKTFEHVGMTGDWNSPFPVAVLGPLSLGIAFEFRPDWYNHASSNAILDNGRQAGSTCGLHACNHLLASAHELCEWRPKIIPRSLFEERGCALSFISSFQKTVIIY